MPDKKIERSKPQAIEYSNNRIRNRSYGRILEEMIQKAIDLDEGEEKEALILLVASNLKKTYLLWNSSSVDDGQILKDLDRMSDGKLKLPEDYVFPSTFDLVGRQKTPSKDNKKNKGRDKNYRKNNSNNNQGRKDNKYSKQQSSSNNYKKRSF